MIFRQDKYMLSSDQEFEYIYLDMWNSCQKIAILKLFMIASSQLVYLETVLDMWKLAEKMIPNYN